MDQPSPDWIADQQRAEADLIDRFNGLDEVLLREGRRLEDAEARALMLDRMPNGSGAALRREIADRRQVMAIASHHLANLDRVHLIEQPARRERRSGGGR